MACNRGRGVMKNEAASMNVKDLAEYLSISEQTVYRMVAEREIPGFKIRGSLRFDREEIRGWRERQRLQPEGSHCAVEAQ
jgi:excisionase family DNA binding protein